MTLIAVVRVRGRVRASTEVKETMRLLNLDRVNHCVLVQDTPQTLGMVKKVKDYVTWGPVKLEVVEAMLEKRARTQGKQGLTVEYLKKNTEYSNVKELGKALMEGRQKMNTLQGAKRVFRLTPPSKGYERGGIKKSVNQGGALGPRSDMSGLLEKMI